MSDALLLTFRIGLLVILWILVLLALNTLRRDNNKVAGVRLSGRAKGRRHAKKDGITLQVMDGPMAGVTMDISAMDEVTIGRSPDCNFVLHDDYASSRHARLVRRGNEWFLEDLESRNGTFLGDYRIDQPERIGIGADIKVGSTTLRLVA